MKSLYQSPLRVYLLLLCLAVWGIVSGIRLPVSLFPNSSKPGLHVSIPLGSLTGEQFLSSFGRDLEGRLKSATFDGHEVEKVTAEYSPAQVSFDVEYKWGAPADEARLEIERVVNSFSSNFPKDVRDGINVWPTQRNSGFFAMTFYSPTRSLTELHQTIEPLITPKLSKVSDAQNPGIWNPDHKEIRVELNPEKMALLQLTPNDVAAAIMGNLQGYSGGTIKVGLRNLEISMLPTVRTLEQLTRIPVLAPSGQTVHLGDVANIDLDTPSSGARAFKTSGVPSLILFASPRPGGNIKKMSEDIVAIIEELNPSFPPDVQYKALVDPSEFIRSAVNNVLHEVFLAALLAVAVLFVFIGNFRNVMTAAIEIPMSIIMAFILMRWFGINLNLISLGGLALSAGMNVDASVVVMENIFRHFDEWKGPMSKKDRLNIVLQAVHEVRFPVIASTIASLVVFLPLALTSGLTNAILSDLAMAVVFSHGLSAFVALILVPTVRLQMMSAAGATTTSHSPIEGFLKRLEAGYANALQKFMTARRLKNLVYAGLVVALALLIVLVIPRLPKEIVGKPDTDWMVLGIDMQSNTTLGQMESQAGDIEARLMKQLGHRFRYTFTEIDNANNATVLARLKDKSEMLTVWKEMEAEFPTTPEIFFGVEAWNPSEMPLPNPPAFQFCIRGNDAQKRQDVARELQDLIDNKQIYSVGLNFQPGISRRESVVLKPDPERWSQMLSKGSRLQPGHLADIARVATVGRNVGEIAINSRMTDIVIRYPMKSVTTVEDLAALPIGLNQKIVPLKALAEVVLQEALPRVYREDGKELIRVNGHLSKEDEPHIDDASRQVEQLLKEWQNGNGKGREATVVIEDARKELNEALQQLGYAVALSIFLIFITMVLQFGSVVNALLVLVAVPLGFIGVLLSLFIFKSSLSLNSALGVILLNGISVANSIILVDFLKRLVDQGVSPAKAALEAAQKRMRPILMTSMTTGLGMLPIALGMGEGGRILQPLGIAVIGGLGVSMTMTLFIVPALQVSYLEWKRKRERMRNQDAVVDISKPPQEKSEIVWQQDHTTDFIENHRVDNGENRMKNSTETDNENIRPPEVT